MACLTESASTRHCDRHGVQGLAAVRPGSRSTAGARHAEKRFEERTMLHDRPAEATPAIDATMMRTPHHAAGTPASPDFRGTQLDFGAALEQQRQFRLDQLDELTKAAANARGAVDPAQAQVNEILRAGAQAALTEVEDALERLRTGVYGRCERCAEPISNERLEILPMSRYCTPCQHVLQTRPS
jgi:RNA polymerase-binding transcription factor DksA